MVKRALFAVGFGATMLGAFWFGGFDFDERGFIGVWAYGLTVFAAVAGWTAGGGDTNVDL